jgi:type I restriction-modification system DNA methylase subunit
MLSVAGEYLAEHNPQAHLTTYRQELNDESYAICKADMLIKGQDGSQHHPGNTLSDDARIPSSSTLWTLIIYNRHYLRGTRPPKLRT